MKKMFLLLLREDDFYIYIVDNLINGIEQAGIYVLNREPTIKFLKMPPQLIYTIHIPAILRENFRVT
jgi:hypothetical protein